MMCPPSRLAPVRARTVLRCVRITHSVGSCSGCRVPPRPHTGWDELLLQLLRCLAALEKRPVSDMANCMSSRPCRVAAHNGQAKVCRACTMHSSLLAGCPPSNDWEQCHVPGHVPVRSGLCDRGVSLQGDAFSVGSCRAACKACKPCSKSDLGCQAENRLNAGFLPMHLDDWE